MRPISGVKVLENFRLAGPLPRAAASARIFVISSAKTFGECEETKIASACVAAKADPAGEVPAWKRNGVRCGDASTIYLVSKL